MSLKKRQLLVILGPTATGKTDLALSLAKKFNGELISCDSRQVYKGLDIGTGKRPGGKFKINKSSGFWEIGGIKIWLYDVADPKIQYSASDYVKDASRVVDDLVDRGKLPIVVGGTGLYLKALLYGLPNLAIPIDLKFRKLLEKLPLQKLQRGLQLLSPKKWQMINDSDRQNPRRLVRHIELALTDFTSEESLRATIRGGFNMLKIGLTAPRNVLYKKVDNRVIDRINQGMIEEAKKLHENGLSFKRMRQLGLEYGVLANFLENKIKKSELVKIMQGKIHGFARRQLTWFKKEKDVLWFDTEDKNFPANVEKVVDGWYHYPK